MAKGNWFSNFRPFDTPLEYNGLIFKYPETFYQAMKAKKEFWGVREKISKMKPAKSKKFWREDQNKKNYMRKDWKKVSLEVMEYVLQYKFAQGTSWGKKLDETHGDIVEWNTWHDNFWGKCTCDKCKFKRGINHLGIMLMKIRNRRM